MHVGLPLGFGMHLKKTKDKTPKHDKSSIREHPRIVESNKETGQQERILIHKVVHTGHFPYTKMRHKKRNTQHKTPQRTQLIVFTGIPRTALSKIEMGWQERTRDLRLAWNYSYTIDASTSSKQHSHARYWKPTASGVWIDPAHHTKQLRRRRQPSKTRRETGNRPGLLYLS